MLGLKIVGVAQNLIVEARQPQPRLQELLKTGPTDQLLAAMERVLGIATQNSGITTRSFGVFGSMLHGFHHPKYSDIDFTIYGKSENAKICQLMVELYSDSDSGLRNEFESEDVMKGKDWRFKNFAVKDFVWHQRRKMIYGLYDDTKYSGRVIKAGPCRTSVIHEPWLTCGIRLLVQQRVGVGTTASWGSCAPARQRHSALPVRCRAPGRIRIAGTGLPRRAQSSGTR